MALASKNEYIRLQWSEKDRRIFVEGKDEDRFSMTVEEAIEACKIYDKEKRASFRKKFDNLLALLGNWCYKRKNKIEKAFFTIRDAGLLFLVVTKAKTYDEHFEEELTELDIEIANNADFSEICLSVQALPSCDSHGYGSFCNPEWTLEYAVLNAD